MQEHHPLVQSSYPKLDGKQQLGSQLGQAGIIIEAVFHLFIVKLEPLLGGRADVSVVVATMDASTVDQHAVQLVQVAHAAVCFRC